LVGGARITRVVPQTLTGTARITAKTTRVQTGTARITVTTTRTATGRSRVQNTSTQTLAGSTVIIGHITASDTVSLSLTETSPETMPVSLRLSDPANLVLGEVQETLVRVQSSDTLQVQLVDPAKLTAIFGSSDAVVVSVAEQTAIVVRVLTNDNADITIDEAVSTDKRLFIHTSDRADIVAGDVAENIKKRGLLAVGFNNREHWI
jgi:hypothetical protein